MKLRLPSTASLIAYGVAGAAILGAAWMAWHWVAVRDAAYERQPALVAERDAAVAAKGLVEKSVSEQVEANGRLERETNASLVAAGTVAHDLAERLRIVSAARRQFCPAPAAPGVDHGTGREPGDSEAIRLVIAAVDRATEAHLTASGRDAAKLTGAQTYIRGLPKRCVPD